MHNGLGILHPLHPIRKTVAAGRVFELKARAGLDVGGAGYMTRLRA